MIQRLSALRLFLCALIASSTEVQDRDIIVETHDDNFSSLKLCHSIISINS